MVTLNQTQTFWLQIQAQYHPKMLTDQQMFRALLDHVIGYATGKLDLCEVSHILSDVLDEFKEEISEAMEEAAS
jgi:hypothetical protein